MHRMLFRGLVLPAALAVAALPGAESREGRYISDGDEMELTVKEPAAGEISGVLKGPDGNATFTAKAKAGRYAGVMEISGESFPVLFEWNGGLVTVAIGPEGEGEMLAFTRAKAAPTKTAKAEEPPKGKTATTRKVSINGMRFTDEDLLRAEKVYGIRVPDADYWYDTVLGAWGVRGSPTLGFLAPGLELGGPLQADASGGGTGVFVNGRELHPHDVIALQQITGPILQGRYFITAQGYAGIEDGPPKWDLGALVAQSGGDGGDGSNTWQSRITGASGFSDGTTGAVFLPNGGIVSTGN
jgi:hypothetical protein